MRYQSTTKQDIRKFSKIIKYISEMGDGPEDDDIVMPKPLAKKKKVWVQLPKSKRVQQPKILRKVAKPNKSMQAFMTQPEATTSAEKKTTPANQPTPRKVQSDAEKNELAAEEQEALVISAIKLERADENFFSCPMKTCCYMTIRQQTMLEHLLHHSLRYHCSRCSNRYSFLAPARAHWAKDHEKSRFTAKSFVRCDAKYQNLVEKVFHKLAKKTEL